LIDRAESAAAQRDQGLQVVVGELRQEVAALPEQLSDGISELAKHFGHTFGSQARAHIGELRQELRKERDEVLQRIEHHEQVWRNNVGPVVQNILAESIKPIQSDLIPPLRRVGDDLREGSEIIRGTLERFVQAHEEWKEAQRDAFKELHRMAERLEGVARALGEGEGHLKKATDTLSKSASDLDEALANQRNEPAGHPQG